MKDLKLKIKNEIAELYELYDYYLDKLEENPYNTTYLMKLNEFRIEMRTYEKVLEMFDE